jgi:hypothetical protein
MKGADEMIQEFEQIALVIDAPEYGLIAGDVGTVVDITTDGKGITVEFFDFVGKTLAIVPLSITDVRPVIENEVMHARPVKSTESD